MVKRLQFKINVEATGDTTPEEIQVTTGQLYAALSERPDVDRIESATTTAPEGAKAGAEVFSLGAMLLAVAPPAVEGILCLIRAMVSRPAAPPVKVSVEADGNSGGKIAIEVPADASQAEVADLARQLLGELRTR